MSVARHGEPGFQVTVVMSPRAREVLEIALQVPPGARIGDALRLCAALPAFEGIDLAQAVTGLWGRRAGSQRLLREGDRLELYRPLLVDPKVARRTRFARQGARATGLFARRRVGGKPGY